MWRIEPKERYYAVVDKIECHEHMLADSVIVQR